MDTKNLQTLIIKPDHLKVSGDGVFYTLQGESESMGRPACFLRLHLCNLQCSWCDTWYTWKQDTPEFWKESADWTIAETKKNIEQAWGCENSIVKKRVVITGGEPLMQKNCLEKLMRLMPEWLFEIETNGTILPTDYMLASCQFNCSPKLLNSKNPKRARINNAVLQTLNNVKTTFKFVVMTPSDLDEIENDFIKPLNLDINKIVVMPQGLNSEEVLINARAVAAYAMKKGYRLLDRLHLNIWGPQRKK